MASLTILHSAAGPGEPRPRLQKTYELDGSGSISITPYQKAMYFRPQVVEVNDIHELARLVEEASKNPYTMIVRGLPDRPRSVVLRRKEFLFEPAEGTHWLMLDFDSVSLPLGIDPLSLNALEDVIRRLPEPFHNRTYFFQHSNSAGIRLLDGSPLKVGLNAHMFFWLSRPVKGSMLCAWLKDHCHRTGFYSLGPDRGGTVAVKYGFDQALLRDVQPHYTSLPHIGPGVECVLSADHRQGLVSRGSDYVEIPELDPRLGFRVRAEQERVRDEFKKAHGYETQVLQTRMSGGGIATTQVRLNPKQKSCRQLLDVDVKPLSTDVEVATFYFAHETTPGSWFAVRGPRAHIAYRHGGDRMLLKELSPAAYEHVRDRLGWFGEVPAMNLSLENGYMPPLDTFAHAKVSLVVAPTASGKTRRVVELVVRTSDVLFVYAASTIALVNQMNEDLEAADVQVTDYRTVSQRWCPAPQGAVVTTVKSLPKILNILRDNAVPHQLVLDEIHVALDEFMKSQPSAERFEQAIAGAQKTYMFTGTLTNVQRTKIPQVVGHALSSLRESDFCRYEFAAVKNNPLVIRPTKNFSSDFIGLLHDLKRRIEGSEQLPRCVIILASSKLDAYRNLIREAGLEHISHVVSRPENSEQEIEFARVSASPLLITSPLFSVGLNFAVEPDIFWCNFTHIAADKNQVIQTLNRANRGAKIADVRLYANPDPETRIRLPGTMTLASEIAEALDEESTINGLFDQHFQLDRVVYQALRRAERNSHAAISELAQDDGFQNFRVIADECSLERDKRRETQFKAAKNVARQGYLGAKQMAAAKVAELGWGELLSHLDLLAKERRSWAEEARRLEREIQDDEHGLLMALCQVGAEAAPNVDRRKIRRLFCAESPWISSQFDRERFSRWAEVESEKTKDLAELVFWLERVREDGKRPAAMGAALTRGEALREAFLALANDEQELVTLRRNFGALKELRARARHGSRRLRDEATEGSLVLLKDLLDPLGISFRSYLERGKRVIDYEQLKIPASWPLSEMRRNLLRRAASLANLPPSQTSPVKTQMEDLNLEPVSIDLCSRCVHCHQYECAIGRHVDWLDDQGLLGFRNLVCTSYIEFRDIAVR